MAKMVFDFYDEKNDECYSDGPVEKELLERVQNGNTDWYKDGNWPIIYHLSHLRHNILNWYPFKQDCSILEIGAGCGALTGFLCTQASWVTALELTRIRSMINFERHKSFDNLEIIVADFSCFRTEKQFDYIIMNGVLEYAAYMCDGTDPYCTFLQKAKSFLKPGGIILLAIENRVGLKYLAGSREDHTGKWFSGINQYVEGERVRTFSKAELTEKIDKSGLILKRFYYPYPDYKFPEEIFTDNSVNSRVPLSEDKHMDMTWECFFSVRSMQKTFIQEKIADRFENSFLVEITDREVSKNEEFQIDYVKISSNRKEQFRIATILDSEHNVAIKIPLNSQAEKHLNSMVRDSKQKQSIFENIPCWSQGKNVVFPLIKGESLQERLEKSAVEGKSDEIKNKLRKIFNTMIEQVPCCEQIDDPLFKAVFGDNRCEAPMHWKKKLNVDLNAENIFLIDDIYQIIDYEWSLECAVPAEFVFWRLLSQLQGVLNEDLRSEILLEMNINQNVLDIFKHWEIHFATEYVGMQSLGVYSQPIAYNIRKILSGEQDPWILHAQEMHDELVKVYDEKGTLALENRQMHDELVKVYDDKGTLALEKELLLKENSRLIKENSRLTDLIEQIRSHRVVRRMLRHLLKIEL